MFPFFAQIEQKSMKVFNNFKRRILIKSLETINEKTDLKLSFKTIRTGRTITSIRFYNYTNKLEIKDNKTPVKTLKQSIKEPIKTPTNQNIEDLEQQIRYLQEQLNKTQNTNIKQSAFISKQNNHIENNMILNSYE